MNPGHDMRNQKKECVRPTDGRTKLKDQCRGTKNAHLGAFAQGRSQLCPVHVGVEITPRNKTGADDIDDRGNDGGEDVHGEEVPIPAHVSALFAEGTPTVANDQKGVKEKDRSVTKELNDGMDDKAARPDTPKALSVARV